MSASQHRSRNVEEALLIGALLTVLVVFVFLNSWRSTVITGLALPVSVLASFIAVWAFGFTLNTMSLLGLSLAIGILIDDAIVVRENIVRHIEMGKDHMTASHEGTDEIGLAVAATTFSIVAVFVPVAFMYGVAGQWFKPFALTIACVGSRFAVRFVLARPDAVGLLGRSAGRSARAPQSDRAHAREIQQWFNRQAERYKRLIAWALDHRVAMVRIAIGVVRRRARASGGRTRRRRASSEPRISRRSTSRIETPPGSNLAYTRIKAEEAARMARVAQGSPVHLHDARRKHGRRGQRQHLRPTACRRADRSIGAEDFGRQLRKEVGHIGGATMSVFTNDFQGAQKQIQIRAARRNTAAAWPRPPKLIAEQVKQVKGAVDVGLSTKGQKPELERRAESRPRRNARRDRGSGRAGAASGIRGNQGGRLGRSDATRRAR